MTDESFSESYYDILKIQPDSTDEDVKAAYRRLVKIYHPDLNKKKRRIAELRLRMLNEAYNTLKTHEDRMRYDQTLKAHAQQKSGWMMLKAGNDNHLASGEYQGFWSAFTQILWPRQSRKMRHPAQHAANKEG